MAGYVAAGTASSSASAFTPGRTRNTSVSSTSAASERLDTSTIVASVVPALTGAPTVTGPVGLHLRTAAAGGQRAAAERGRGLLLLVGRAAGTARHRGRRRRACPAPRRSRPVARCRRSARRDLERVHRVLRDLDGGLGLHPLGRGERADRRVEVADAGVDRRDRGPGLRGGQLVLPLGRGDLGQRGRLEPGSGMTGGGLAGSGEGALGGGVGLGLGAAGQQRRAARRGRVDLGQRRTGLCQLSLGLRRRRSGTAACRRRPAGRPGRGPPRPCRRPAR